MPDETYIILFPEYEQLRIHMKASWIRQTHLFQKDEYQCSACGFLTGKPAAARPHCGTKMKSAKYDPSWADEMTAFDALFDG